MAFYERHLGSFRRIRWCSWSRWTDSVQQASALRVVEFLGPEIHICFISWPRRNDAILALAEPSSPCTIQPFYASHPSALEQEMGRFSNGEMGNGVKKKQGMGRGQDGKPTGTTL